MLNTRFKMHNLAQSVNNFNVITKDYHLIFFLKKMLTYKGFGLGYFLNNTLVSKTDLMRQQLVDLNII